jgi:hypothetical protein
MREPLVEYLAARVQHYLGGRALADEGVPPVFLPTEKEYYSTEYRLTPSVHL